MKQNKFSESLLPKLIVLAVIFCSLIIISNLPNKNLVIQTDEEIVVINNDGDERPKTSNKWYLDDILIYFDTSLDDKRTWYDMVKIGNHFIMVGHTDENGAFNVYLYGRYNLASDWRSIIDIPSATNEYGTDIANDTDGHLYLTGYANRTNSGSTYDAFIMKVDNTTHNPVWTNFYNGSNPVDNEYGRDIQVKDDIIYVLISYNNTVRGYREALIERYYLNGTFIDNATWGLYQGLNSDFNPTVMYVNSTGDIYISGMGPTDQLNDYHVAIFDSNLNSIQNITFNTISPHINPVINGIVVNEITGRIFLSGHFYNDSAQVKNTHATLWGIDKDGTSLWNTSIMNPIGTALNGLKAYNNNLYSCGWYNDTSQPNTICELLINVSQADGSIIDYAVDFDDDGVDINYELLKIGNNIYVCGVTEYDSSTDIPYLATWQGVYNHDPVLSDASLSPNSGSEDTNFQFNVTFTDLDNYNSETVYLWLSDGTITHKFTMNEVNALDTDRTDGKGYTYTTNLTGGYWQYYFKSADDYASVRLPLGSVNFPGPVVNYRPQLLNGKVDPELGINTTTYNFTVIWQDNDNEAPLSLNVYIDGTPYSMDSSGSIDYTGGVTYNYTTSSLDWGAHNFYFIGSDGNHTVLSPRNAPAETYTVTVNILPILSDGNVNSSFAPIGGAFNFTVNYTESQNTAPTSINTIIGGTPYAMVQVNPSDTDYTDGAIFTAEVKLAPGSYEYSFECSDGLNTVYLPPSGAVGIVTAAKAGIYPDGYLVKIDGYINPSEWADASFYSKIDSYGYYDAWIARNSTGIFVAMNITVSQGVIVPDSVVIWFDEGDDGYYGSGRFDNVETDNQEDYKLIDSSNTLLDGYCLSGSPSMTTDGTDWDAVMTWNTSGTPRYEVEWYVPFQGRDGDASDRSDLNVTIFDTILMNFEYLTFNGISTESAIFLDDYIDHFSPLNLNNMKWGFENYSVPQSADTGFDEIIIDGYVNLTEWENELFFEKWDSKTGLDVYFSRNSTHLLIGVITNDNDSNYFEELLIFFDEGNDGSYGSGSRDNILTANQEDWKGYSPNENLWLDGDYNSGWSGGSSSTPPNDWMIKSQFINTFHFEVAIPFESNDGPGDSDLNVSLLDTFGIRIDYDPDTGDTTEFPRGADNDPNSELYMGLTLGDLKIEQDQATKDWQSASTGSGLIWVNGSVIEGAEITVDTIEILPISPTTSNLTGGSFSTNLGTPTSFNFQNLTAISDGIWWLTLKATKSTGTSELYKAYLKVDSTYPIAIQDYKTSNSTAQTKNRLNKVYINGTMQDVTSGVNNIEIIAGSGNFSNTFSANQKPLSSGEFSFENTSNVAFGSYWGTINITDNAGNEYLFNFGFIYLPLTPASFSNFQIDLTSGDITDIFTIEIDVKQAENVTPNFVYLSVVRPGDFASDNISLVKSDPSDNDYTDGMTYNYTGLLPHGDLRFDFWVDDTLNYILHSEDPVTNILYNVVCPQLTTSVTMNGQISAGEWDEALLIDGTTQPGLNGMLIYLKYDSNYLYIGAEFFTSVDLNSDELYVYYEFDGDGVLTTDIDKNDRYDRILLGGVLWWDIRRNYEWSGSAWSSYTGSDGSWSDYDRAYTTSPKGSFNHLQMEVLLDLDHAEVGLAPGDPLMLMFNYNAGSRGRILPFWAQTTSTSNWLNLTLATVDNPPTSNTPDNKVLKQHQTGPETYINWTLADDVDAGNYSIYVNGDPEVIDQPWPISWKIDYQINTTQTPGLYNYTIIFSDNIGQINSDTVWVTIEILESGDDEDEKDKDGKDKDEFNIFDFLTSPLGIGILISVGAVIGVVIIVLKKRSKNIKEIKHITKIIED